MQQKAEKTPKGHRTWRLLQSPSPDAYPCPPHVLHGLSRDRPRRTCKKKSRRVPAAKPRVFAYFLQGHRFRLLTDEGNLPRDECASTLGLRQDKDRKEMILPTFLRTESNSFTSYVLKRGKIYDPELSPCQYPSLCRRRLSLRPLSSRFRGTRKRNQRVTRLIRQTKLRTSSH